MARTMIETLVTRVGVAVMWLTFAVFHLCLAVAFLLVVWACEISPGDVATAAGAVAQRAHGATLLSILGVLGVSGALLLRWYIRLWRRLYSRLTTPLFFRGLP